MRERCIGFGAYLNLFFASLSIFMLGLVFSFLFFFVL
jgi:hypothetical protein